MKREEKADSWVIQGLFNYRKGSDSYIKDATWESRNRVRYTGAHAAFKAGRQMNKQFASESVIIMT